MRRVPVAVVACVVAIMVPARETVAQSRTARTVRFASDVLSGSEATFAVLLPPSYDASEKRYPVVYLLHGGTQNHTAFPARTWFSKEVARREIIVVMPHVPQSLYNTRGGSSRMAFLDFIAQDLVSYVDATYRTVASRESRAIAGLSMGGFGAVMAALAHPQLFGHAGAFSGAFTAGREQLLVKAVDDLPDDLAPYVYLSCGEDDTVVEASRGVAALLAERRIAHEYREVPGGHTWEVWDPQTLAFLDILTRQPAWPRPR
jgi:enterochelin esterase-like enzyme